MGGGCLPCDCGVPRGPRGHRNLERCRVQVWEGPCHVVDTHSGLPGTVPGLALQILCPKSNLVLGRQAWLVTLGPYQAVT